MRKYFLLLMIVFCCKMFGQNPIDVYESTVKIGESETQEYLCGLAEGDQLLFSFEVVKGRKLDKIEILEYPSFSKFSDYKTSKIDRKTITIPNTGIYLFRFSNLAGSDKVCKYKIERIPANEQKARFNTTVYWKTVNDTTYYNAGEQTVTTLDTVISNITDRVQNVHSSYNMKGNRISFNFALPPKTTACSYYIGVNQAGSKAFADASGSLLRSASPFVSKIPGYGPLAALALNGTSFLTTLVGGESVQYWITDAANAKLFDEGKPFKYIKQGNVVNDFSRITTPLKGEYFVCLQNDNKVQSIDVTVKITAVTLQERKTTRPIRKYSVESKSVPYLKK